MGLPFVVEHNHSLTRDDSSAQNIPEELFTVSVFCSNGCRLPQKRKSVLVRHRLIAYHGLTLCNTAEARFNELFANTRYLPESSTKRIPAARSDLSHYRVVGTDRHSTFGYSLGVEFLPRIFDFHKLRNFCSSSPK